MAVSTRTRAPGRTITIRLRPLVITLALILFLAVFVGGLRWVFGLAPLQPMSGAYGNRGLAIVAGTHSPGDTGPPLYTWTAGGRYEYMLWLKNSGSLPITVTGTPNDGMMGIIANTTLGFAPEPSIDRVTPFHPVTIPAGGEKGITFIFRSDPRACRIHADPDSTETVYAVTLNFDVLGVFHDSQKFPLDPPLFMRAPTRAACAAAGLS